MKFIFFVYIYIQVHFIGLTQTNNPPVEYFNRINSINNYIFRGDYTNGIKAFDDLYDNDILSTKDLYNYYLLSSHVKSDEDLLLKLAKEIAHRGIDSIFFNNGTFSSIERLSEFTNIKIISQNSKDSIRLSNKQYLNDLDSLWKVDQYLFGIELRNGKVYEEQSEEIKNAVINNLNGFITYIEENGFPCERNVGIEVWENRSLYTNAAKYYIILIHCFQISPNNDLVKRSIKLLRNAYYIEREITPSGLDYHPIFFQYLYKDRFSTYRFFIENQCQIYESKSIPNHSNEFDLFCIQNGFPTIEQFRNQILYFCRKEKPIYNLQLEGSPKKNAGIYSSDEIELKFNIIAYEYPYCIK